MSSSPCRCHHTCPSTLWLQDQKKGWVRLSTTKLCSRFFLPFIFIVHTCMCSQFVSAQVEKSERYPCINRAIFESGNTAGRHNIRICYNCIFIVNKFVLMLHSLKRTLSSGLKRRKSVYCPHLFLHQVMTFH